MPQRSGNDRVGALGDLERIVFDPAGAGQDLLVLELVPCDLPAGGVEDEESRARGALVQRPDELRHADHS